MNSTDHDDGVVRAEIQRLKADDARVLPSFAVVLAGRPVRSPRLRSSAPRWIAAAVIVIVGAVAYRETRLRSRTFIVPDDISALVSWRPASNVLLPSPTQIMGPRPALGRSILDFNLPTRGPQL